MNRGDRREEIFADDKDRERFVGTLGEACGKTGWQVHAYCLTNIIDALNNATLFVRDAAGRLQYQTNANNEILQFTYNPADELLTLTDDKNQMTRWNYNQYGWVTNKLDQSNTEILRYTYNPDGRLTNRWSAAKGNTKYLPDTRRRKPLRKNVLQTI